MSRVHSLVLEPATDRQHRMRTPFTTPIRYQTISSDEEKSESPKQGWGRAVARNIGVCGLSMVCPFEMPIGHSLRLTLEFPGCLPVDVRGVIGRRRRVFGGYEYDVRFDSLKPAERDRITSYAIQSAGAVE